MKVLSAFEASFERWRKHPRKWDLLYVMGVPLGRMRNWWRAEKNRRSLLVPPIDTSRVEILVDANFRRSVEEVRKYTMLDVARLANLWYLAKLAGQGVFLEVGTYRGGGALHICNAIKDRGDPFYCFDPFEKGGFQTLGQEDAVFGKNDFMDTSYQAVSNLLAGMPNARVIQGFFPGAAKQIGIRNIAFCHLDVDVYEATRASLEYLAERLAPRSLIVLDDINRDIRGVDNAVSDFLKTHRSFLFLPMFPSQGLLLSKSLW